ncbi:MAG TPA: hypothetical protein VFM21_05435 [Terriglobia bacterium]|nr:hypothetical protein [Terriglobia bacterium]
MSAFSLAIVIWGLGLEVVILARALATRMTAKFPIFYSYIAFVLACEIVVGSVLHFYPAHYTTDYWFYFVARTLAEFGVLFEVSDSVFKPYPTVRNLGRLLIILTCIVFALWYGLPMEWSREPSWVRFLELIKISAVTKAIAIAALLGFARSYRIPVGRNAGGILLGFAAYLAAQASTFGAALYFGRAIYAPVLSWLGPVGFGICLSVWTVALWKPDSVAILQPAAGDIAGEAAYRPEIQLRRFSTFVTRFLSK